MTLPPRIAAQVAGRPPTEGERALAAPSAPLPPGDLDEIRRLVVRSPSDLELRPVQLEALAELRRAGGLLGGISVGGGKELICLLAASAIDCERPMLLCPSGLVVVSLEEAMRFGGAFRIRPDLVIVPYELLSRPERAGLLDRIRPDLIIANEAHHLRNKGSARTRRVLRYLEEHDECRFAGVSGTLTAGSLRDYAHLAEAALWERSPVPRDGAELSAWAAVVDADGDPLPRDFAVTRGLIKTWGGSLADRFMSATSNPQLQQDEIAKVAVGLLSSSAAISPPRLMRAARSLGWGEGIEAGEVLANLLQLDGWVNHSAEPYAGRGMSAVWSYVPTKRWRDLCDQQTVARTALRRRLAATPGVVLTKASSCDCSLIIRRLRQPEVPASVREVMTEVEQSGMTPDGERWLETPEQIATCLRQLALGFSYSWDWSGVAEDVRRRWLDARKAWSAALRSVLERGDPELDSPKRVEDAILSKTGQVPLWVVERYCRWQNEQAFAAPAKTTTWHDRWLVEDAARWLDDLDEPGILWYRHQAFGQALRELGVDVRGEGESPPTEFGPVALSCAGSSSHCQGHNLQHGWRLNRIAGLPSSAAIWEQLIGRTHRDGQRADVVICDTYAHHSGERRALARAIKRAQAIEQTTGQSQKLLLARIVDAAGSYNY